MARFLLLCLLLLISLPSNAQCSYQLNTQGFITNAQCTENAGISTKSFLQFNWCPGRPTDPICNQFDKNEKPVYTTETQTIPCPNGQPGTITQTRQVSNAGYTGFWSTMASTCMVSQVIVPVCSQTTPEFCPKPAPPPALEPVQVPKSEPVATPTLVPAPVTPLSQQMNNPLNPISPISPLAPPTPQAPKQTSNGPSTTEITILNGMGNLTNQDAAQESSQTQLAAPATRGKIIIRGLGSALSLDTLAKPGIKQGNLFPAQNMLQEIPPEMLMQDKTMMSLLQVEPITQQPLKEELDFTQ